MAGPAHPTGVEPLAVAIAAEERLARESLDNARVAENGEEWAAQRIWRLRCAALRSNHPRWAERLLALHGQVQARLEAARSRRRAAIEQLEKLEERRRSAPFRSQTRQLARKAAEGDEALLPEVVQLVKSGELTKTITGKLGIGVSRVKRIRALARRRGLL